MTTRPVPSRSPRGKPTRRGRLAGEAIFVSMTEPRRRTTTTLASIAAIVATLIAGCGQNASSTTAQTAPSGQTSNVTTTTHRPPTPAHEHGQHAAGANQRNRTALAYSSASAQAVHPQPRPSSCYSIGTGLSARPDPRCTPGALNPAVTQASIGATICVPGWTASVRPPESVTEPEKRASIDAYGDAGPISSYEYDHFVPLELGGAVNDPRNLWPEPGASPNPKDTVENELKQKLCHGQITLTDAQRAITTNWTTLAAAASAPARSSTSTTPRRQSSPPPGRAHCTVSASYNSAHHDYDVYVNSNQPDQTVTVTDAAGHSDSWHTNSDGYADVYFHAGGDAAGQTITARVGSATCQATL
jgi:hypothetical protein